MRHVDWPSLFWILAVVVAIWLAVQWSDAFLIID